MKSGENRFVAPQNVIDDLIKNGQVAFQYTDLNGDPSMDIAWNPNGSMCAIEGITSFSTRPIRLISSMGFLILFITLVMAIYTLVSFFIGRTVEGWTSLMLSFWFLGSVLLIAIGTIGEYIGKIYIEVKQRPRYNIETFLTHDHES